MYKRHIPILALWLVASCAHLSVTKDAQGESREARLVVPAASGLHGVAWFGGALLVADSFGHFPGAARRSLHRWSGQQWDDLGLAGTLPSGMEVIDDRLYVCDTGTNTVSVFDADLTFLTHFEVPAPWNVAGAPDGRLFAVSNDGSVYQLAGNEPARRIFSGLDAPFDIAITESGELWLSEQGSAAPGRVTLRTEAGDILRRFEDLDNPEGLLLDSAGKLWIADTGADRIYQVTRDAITPVTEAVAFPIIGVEAHGEVWFNGAVGGVYGIYSVGTVQPE